MSDAEQLKAILADAVRAVDPRRLVREFCEGLFGGPKPRATPPPNPLPEAERGDRKGICPVPLLRFGEGDRGWGGSGPETLANSGNVLVVGGGKAGGAMALGLEDVFGDRVTGWVNVPADAMPETRFIRLHAARPGGTNLPTLEGVIGSNRILELVTNAAASRTPIIALISGGGSALLPAPVEGVSLADKLAATKLLQDAGVSIDGVNTVRKHLSRIKGGGLARAAGESTLLSLIISDVSEDLLDVIASGPTLPDPTTFADALKIARNSGVSLPRTVLDYLQAGVVGERPETLKQIIPGQFTHVLANNRSARVAAASSADALGWAVNHRDCDEGGPNDELADGLVSRIRSIASTNPRRPILIVSGGETTVKLCASPGRGGRNQELGLEIWLRLTHDERTRVTILTAGTDGEDGPTDAAGCLIDASNVHLSEDAVRQALSSNDVFPLLEQTGTLLRTGPTGTNVMDLRLILIR